MAILKLSPSTQYQYFLFDAANACFIIVIFFGSSPKFHILTIIVVNMVTSFRFIPTLQKALSHRTGTLPFASFWKHFYHYVDNVVFPMYLFCSLVAITLAPTNLIRTIAIGGSIFGMLTQVPITGNWIMPIHVIIQELEQSEEMSVDAEQLAKWKTFGIYKIGFHCIGICTMSAALVLGDDQSIYLGLG